MDILEGFIKKLEHEINREKNELTSIEHEIAQLKAKQNSLFKKYSQLEQSEYTDLLSLSLKNSSMLNILKEIKNIEKQVLRLEEKAEDIRLRIKQKNAEKKAIKNYQEKIKKEKEIEDIKKETQLIDEIFNRNS
ncbi:MAG TPA: hypothetical protein ENK22_04720 [Persephonella sp.]|nr:hypothetical protein [Persephonella sp.]